MKNYKSVKENIYFVKSELERCRDEVNLKSFFRKNKMMGDLMTFMISDKIILETFDLENSRMREELKFSVKLIDGTVRPFHSFLVFRKIDNDFLTKEDLAFISKRINFLSTF